MRFTRVIVPRVFVFTFLYTNFCTKTTFFADTWLFFSEVCLSRYNQFTLRFANKKSKDGGCLLSVTLALCDTFWLLHRYLCLRDSGKVALKVILPFLYSAPILPLCV